MGCADSHERVVQDAIATMTELVDTMDSINTVDEAKAAQGELDRLVHKMQAIQARFEALGTPDKTLQTALAEKFKDETSEVLKKYLTTQFKLATKPEVNQETRKSLKNLKRMPLKFTS